MPSAADEETFFSFKKKQLLDATYTFFKINGVGILVWTMGYFRFSVSWLLLGSAVFVSYQLKKARRHQSARLGLRLSDNEKQVILASVKDVPSWVHFPDCERAEWINKILLQLWPNIVDYVKGILKNQLEVKLNSSLPSLLTPFSFKEMDFGDRAPRVGGVKVYTGSNVKRDEIIMDVEIYLSSEGTITVRLNKFDVGMEDFQVKGTLRVTMTPLVPKIPFIGAITATFLNQPTIQFDMTNLADFLDFPGISSAYRNILDEAVSSIIVLPNRVTIPLTDNMDVNTLRHPMPDGAVRIHVICGKDLVGKDNVLIGKKTSDPYCKLRVGTMTFKTKTCKENLNPVWNAYFESIIDEKTGQNIEMEVYDNDKGQKDDFMGRISIDLESVAKKGFLDTWVYLESVKSGTIHLELTWLNLSDDPSDFKKAISAIQNLPKDKDTPLYAGYIRVFLDSAKDLQNPKRIEEPSPYAVLTLGNQEMKSQTMQNTPNPTWQEYFQFFVQHPEVENLNIEYKDANHNNNSLGKTSIPMKTFLSEESMVINRHFRVKDGNPNANVYMYLALRALTPGISEETISSVASAIKDAVPKPATPAASTSAGAAAPEIITPSSSVSETVPEKKFPSPDANEVRLRRPIGSDVDRNTREASVKLEDPPSDMERLPGPNMQLTLRYSRQRQTLIVVVHKVVDLKSCDSDGLADPYVKVIILPKDLLLKKKTKRIENSLNPVFDETLEFSLPQSNMPSAVLQLNVISKGGKLSTKKRPMGSVEIPLSSFVEGKALSKWFPISAPSNQ